MLLVTHLSIPVGLALFDEVINKDKYSGFGVNKIGIILLAFSGNFPDIINPHIYLDDRLDSYSHTVWICLLSLIITLPLIEYKLKIK